VISLKHLAHEECDLIVLEGRLIASVCDGIADELIALFDDGCGVMHLDFSAVEFIDSKGLSMMVNVMKRVHKDEGVFVLLNISDEVRALLELTRLHDVFDIREDDSTGHERAA